MHIFDHGQTITPSMVMIFPKSGLFQPYIPIRNLTHFLEPPQCVPRLNGHDVGIVKRNSCLQTQTTQTLTQFPRLD